RSRCYETSTTDTLTHLVYSSSVRRGVQRQIVPILRRQRACSLRVVRLASLVYSISRDVTRCLYPPPPRPFSVPRSRMLMPSGRTRREQFWPPLRMCPAGGQDHPLVRDGTCLFHEEVTESPWDSLDTLATMVPTMQHHREHRFTP